MSPDIHEAMVRLSRIDASSRDYTKTVIDVYATDPKGQFWDDLSAVLAHVAVLDAELSERAPFSKEEIRQLCNDYEEHSAEIVSARDMSQHYRGRGLSMEGMEEPYTDADVLLKHRDDFIVSKGLWTEFTDEYLPALKT